MIALKSQVTDSPVTTREPPLQCPVCGQGLSEYPYYQELPGRAAKVVRKVALALMPIMAVIYLYWLFFGPGPMGFGTGHDYFAVFVICGPSLLLYSISRLFPRVRNVFCLRCSWNHEYPLNRRARPPA